MKPPWSKSRVHSGKSRNDNFINLIEFLFHKCKVLNFFNTFIKIKVFKNFPQTQSPINQQFYLFIEKE
ncbi:hypothetical protein DBR39_10915 [Chryseobacterium sp. KBW03]|nr:hypothetical protein DBR39_10915 [Chryseobacterium sp. KBW03]